MSGLKATPAPWQRFDDGGLITLSGADAKKHVYGSPYADVVWGPAGPGHGIIADCSPDGQATSEQSIANAHLIAAAPELYEALSAVMGWISNWDPNFSQDDEWPDDASKAMAALAKARGKAS